jgi:hypothetical protein
MSKNIYVTGPINAVRLEGNIFGIKKQIYIFMDWHTNHEAQTSCTQKDSMTIKDYMVKEAKKLSQNSKLDIILEADDKKPHKSEDLHIVQTQKFFKAQVDKNKFLQKQKLSLNPTMSPTTSSDVPINVRLHYIDIERYIEQEKLKNIKELYEAHATLSVLDYLTSDNVDMYMTKYTQLENTLMGTYNMIFNPNIITTSLIKDDFHKKINRSINKITSNYNHSEIRHKMDPLFDDYARLHNICITTIHRSVNLLKKAKTVILERNKNLKLINFEGYKFHNYYDTTEFKDFISELYGKLKILDNLTRILYGKIIEIFILRRLLDKDYITTCAFYTGIRHSMTYIYFMIKYFDFKITHVCHSREQNLERLNSIIIAAKQGEDIEELFYPPVVIQCIDLGGFPKGFQ